MSRKAKDYIILTVVLLLVTTIFAIVIYDAVMLNKPPEPLDIYIDKTPINYKDADKAVFAFKFSHAITNLTSDIGINSNNEGLQDLISKVLDAMGKARIPAEKLGKIADVITKASVDIVDFFTKNGDIPDEKLQEMIETAKIEHIANFSNDFFKETTLTEDEFSLSLYHYMRANATTKYKQAMYKLGEKDYVTFISNTLYLVNTLGEISQNEQKVESNVLQAVIYELGSKYLEILDKVGIEAIQTVLGFGWHYTGADPKVASLNTYLDSITGKLGYLFGIAGYTMKAITNEDIDKLAYFVTLDEGKEKNDCLIYLQSIISKAVFSGMVNSLKYLDGQITNLNELFPDLKNMIVDSYRLRNTLTNEEESAELVEYYENNFDKFAQALVYFSDKTLTLEEIMAMEDNEIYTNLLDNAKHINDFNVVLDDFVFNIIFVWARNILTGANLEA